MATNRGRRGFLGALGRVLGAAAAAPIIMSLPAAETAVEEEAPGVVTIAGQWSEAEIQALKAAWESTTSANGTWRLPLMVAPP